MEFPEPVISMAIEPKSKADREKLSMALSALSEEDPTFRVITNEETGQTIIAGMGELHLEILHDRMKREFSVEANVGKPQVSYKETITMPGTSQTKYVKQSGGRGQYAHVELEIEPNEKGKGNEVVSKIVGGVIPREYIPAVIKGVEEGLQQVFWPATTLSMSKSPSFLVPTMMLTPTRWPLKFADRWPSKMLPVKRSLLSLNRS